MAIRGTGREKAPRIAINGCFLDRVQTRLEATHARGSVLSLLLPEEHHRVVSADEEGVTLRLPALTALQLYFDGIIPVDRQQPVQLEVSGRVLGRFTVEWLRALEGNEFREPVLLRLGRAT